MAGKKRSADTDKPTSKRQQTDQKIQNQTKDGEDRCKHAELQAWMEDLQQPGLIHGHQSSEQMGLQEEDGPEPKEGHEGHHKEEPCGGTL